MLLLTGQRRGEVAGMRWDELDLEKALWSLPASRTKNRKTHEVPLSDAAVAVIREMPRRGPYIFTMSGVRPVGNYGRGKAAIDQAFDQDLPRWTFHDLRRTAVSGMARLGIPLAVIEKVVNHTSGSFAGIVGVYQRHSFADEKRKGAGGVVEVRAVATAASGERGAAAGSAVTQDDRTKHPRAPSRDPSKSIAESAGKNCDVTPATPPITDSLCRNCIPDWGNQPSSLTYHQWLDGLAGAAMIALSRRP